MKTEFDGIFFDYWQLRNGIFFVKMKRDDELDDDCDIENALAAHLGTAFILGNSKNFEYFYKGIERFLQ